MSHQYKLCIYQYGPHQPRVGQDFCHNAPPLGQSPLYPIIMMRALHIKMVVNLIKSPISPHLDVCPGGSRAVLVGINNYRYISSFIINFSGEQLVRLLELIGYVWVSWNRVGIGRQ